MNFASRYALDVSDEEDAGGEDAFEDVSRPLAYSDVEDGSASDSSGDDDDETAAAAAAAAEASAAQQRARRAIKVRRTDTNVVSVALGTLQDRVNEITGDPTLCPACGAVLSALSQVAADGLWRCEFCGAETPSVRLEPEEIPRTESVDYVRVAPPSAAASAASASAAAGCVFFVVDSSGSMCVTLEVPARGDKASRRLRQAVERRLRAMRAFAQFGDLNQRQPHDVVHVSRLQCVQTAIESQLQRLAQTAPATRVCLLTFSSDVIIHGDGSGEKLVIAGDKLQSRDAVAIAAAAFERATTLKPISESRQALVKCVEELEEGGQTALGPALVAALSISAKAAPGVPSSIILATDGASNVGVGSVEQASESPEKQEACAEFYRAQGQQAKESGTMISVVSIEGTVCRLEELGALAEATGGHVTRVNPLNLMAEFGNILDESIVATNVVATILVHRVLHFRSEEGDVAAEEPAEAAAAAAVGNVSKIRREIGNVTAGTEVTFEYGLKRGVHHGSHGLTSVPFQVQIEFKRVADGTQGLRVITKSQPLTADRTVAEQQADIGLLGTHAAQRAAQLAGMGEYSQARAEAFANKKYLKRIAQTGTTESRTSYNVWKTDAHRLESVLHRAQRREARRGLTVSPPVSDGEAEEDVPAEAFAPVLNAAATVAMEFPSQQQQQQRFAPSKKKQQQRSTTRDDRTAAVLYGLRAYSVQRRQQQQQQQQQHVSEDDEDADAEMSP